MASGKQLSVGPLTVGNKRTLAAIESVSVSGMLRRDRHTDTQTR